MRKIFLFLPLAALPCLGSNSFAQCFALSVQGQAQRYEGILTTLGVENKNFLQRLVANYACFHESRETKDPVWIGEVTSILKYIFLKNKYSYDEFYELNKEQKEEFDKDTNIQKIEQMRNALSYCIHKIYFLQDSDNKIKILKIRLQKYMFSKHKIDCANDIENIFNSFNQEQSLRKDKFFDLTKELKELKITKVISSEEQELLTHYISFIETLYSFFQHHLNHKIPFKHFMSNFKTNQRTLFNKILEINNKSLILDEEDDLFITYGSVQNYENKDRGIFNEEASKTHILANQK